MKRLYPILALVALLAGCASPNGAPAATTAAATPGPDKVAAKPLYHDPVYDGATDPTFIWSPADKKWFMFYTSRRANAPGLQNIESIHGSPIGIATSDDGGATWKYLRDANIIYKDAVPDKTYWAPAVVEHNGLFHMYLVYVPGTFSDWKHPRYILHLTSKDLINWQYESTLQLSHPSAIDAGVLHLPDGTWRLWYKDEGDSSSCHYADSPDLYNWTDHGKVPSLSDASGEAPLAFHWQGHYWFLRDITGRPGGLALYRSDDVAMTWKRVGTLLLGGGTGPEDGSVGHHPDVIISNDRAYMFYFVGLGRRSAIQVTELHYDADKNILTVDRNAPTMINLQPPADVETESKVD